MYIIVNLDSDSLTVCLWCSGDCQFSLCVIAVGLLWRGQSLFRVIYVMYISGSSLLHHYPDLRFVYVLFGGGVPDDRSVFKCWSNKGLITV